MRQGSHAVKQQGIANGPSRRLRACRIPCWSLQGPSDSIINPLIPDSSATGAHHHLRYVSPAFMISEPWNTRASCIMCSWRVNKEMSKCGESQEWVTSNVICFRLRNYVTWHDGKMYTWVCVRKRDWRFLKRTWVIKITLQSSCPFR